MGTPGHTGHRPVGLPRSARLLTSADFARVFSHPRRYADPFFTVLSAPSSVSPGRLGLAVSKKQLKRAVDRNRMKRLIRETYRHERPRLTNCDVVVMVRRSAIDIDGATLRKALRRLFDRVRQDNPRPLT